MFSSLLIPPDFPLPPDATPEQVQKREEAREARRVAGRRHMAVLITAAAIMLAAVIVAAVALMVVLTSRFGGAVPAIAVFGTLAVTLLYVEIVRCLERDEGK